MYGPPDADQVSKGGEVPTQYKITISANLTVPNILHCSDLYVPTNEIRRILLWLQVPWNLLYEADQEEEGSFHDTIQVGGTHQVENLVFLVVSTFAAAS